MAIQIEMTDIPPLRLSIDSPSQQYEQQGHSGAILSRQLWQLWPGKNRFLWNGNIMIGPRGDNIQNIVTWFIMLVLLVSYFVFLAPYLWLNVSPIVPGLSAYFSLCTLFFMVMTSITDPGIIPRKSVWLAMGGVPDNYTANILAREPDAGASYKYCKTCEIFRPPRAHHCARCDNCVELFDHHCPYLNNCIGKRNYCYFLGFVGSTVMMGCVYIAGFFLFLFYEDTDALDCKEKSSKV